MKIISMFVDFDETDGLAIRLQGTESVLLADLWVIIQGTKNQIVMLGKLL